MVFSGPEPTDSFPPATQTISQLEWLSQLARPLDRAAALVIDGIVLSALLGLTTSRAQYGVELSRLLNDLTQLKFEIWVLVIVGVLTMFLYQLTQWSLFGRTIGQRVVGVEVVNVFTGQSPGLIESATRSLFWWLDLMFLLPNLGIFRDPLRRPFHDRVSNTIVISRRRFGPRPHRRERRASELVTATIISTLTWVSLAILSPENRWIMSTVGARGADLDCQSVEEVKDSLPEDQDMSELELALVLYTAGKVDLKCVDQASRKAAREMPKDPLVRFARSLSNSSEAELSNEYLDKVCEFGAQSEVCQLSKAYDEISQGRSESAIKRLRSFSSRAPTYVLLLASKQLERLGQFEDVHRLLNAVVPFPEIEDYLGQLGVSALWGLERDSEARVLFQASLPRFSSRENRVRFASWMCRMEMDRACAGTQQLPCQRFHREILGDSTLLSDEGIGLTHLVHERCSHQAPDRLGRLARFSGSVNLMDFTEALADRDPISRREKLLDLISDSKVSAAVRSEVFQILLAEDASSSIEEKVDLFWSVAQLSDWYWRSAGLSVARAIARQKDFGKLASFVGQWKDRGGLPSSLRTLDSQPNVRLPASRGSRK